MKVLTGNKAILSGGRTEQRRSGGTSWVSPGGRTPLGCPGAGTGSGLVTRQSQGCCSNRRHFKISGLPVISPQSLCQAPRLRGAAEARLAAGRDACFSARSLAPGSRSFCFFGSGGGRLVVGCELPGR